MVSHRGAKRTVSFAVTMLVLAMYASIAFAEDSATTGTAVSPIAPAKKGDFLLRAHDATIHGKSAKYESDGLAKDGIGSWSDSQDWVSWDIDVPKTGEFLVSIKYSCDKGFGGSSYELDIDDKAVAQGNVKETGSWTTYGSRTLGTVSISSKGKHTVSIKATKLIGGQFMNLQEVRLTPKLKNNAEEELRARRGRFSDSEHGMNSSGNHSK